MSQSVVLTSFLLIINFYDFEIVLIDSTLNPLYHEHRIVLFKNVKLFCNNVRLFYFGIGGTKTREVTGKGQGVGRGDVGGTERYPTLLVPPFRVIDKKRVREKEE